jgi:ribosomal protein L11 methyltransferase
MGSDRARAPGNNARMAIRKIVIVPAWEERKKKKGELLLRIKLGRKGALSFGFGAHATTSSCLSLIAGLYGPKAPKPRRVLDVGSGSGVLSIACALLGAREVQGIDIAQAALDVAPENAAANGVDGKCSFSLTPLAKMAGTFDLVVANILAPPLRELCPLLCARAKGGLLLISGFKEHEREELLALFIARGPKLQMSLQREEWCAALFRA